MSFFPEKYHTPGTSPGTLTHDDAAPPVPVQLRVIDYNDKLFVEESPNTVAECRDGSDPSTVTWIHVQGQPSPKLLAELGEHYNIHPLALEDVQNTGQRPKIDEYGALLFLVLAVPWLKEGELGVSQLSIFLRDSVLVTLYEGEHDPFEPIRGRLRAHAGRVRMRGVDYLLYRVIDLAVDLAYPVLDRFAERIEDLELVVLESATEETLQQLHVGKRELLVLRRFLAPQRDALQIFLNEETDALSEETRVFLRDCVDHMVHIMDLIEMHREHMSSILDSHLTNTNKRLNEVMRVLTVISTIFLPLNFLVGIYGMNFEHASSPWAMPELHSYYGYPIVLGVAAGIAVTMLLLMRRRKWI